MHSPCHFKTTVECNCQHGICWAQPESVPAPVIRFTARDHLTVIAFGLVMAALAFGTMKALDKYETQFAQEARI